MSKKRLTLLNKYIYYFLYFFLGSLLLCLLSAFQKILAGPKGKFYILSSHL